MNWEVVERLGGWAVLVFVCIWLMRRFEFRDKMLEKAFEKLSEAVATFSSIERQNREDHATIVSILDRMERKTTSSN